MTATCDVIGATVTDAITDAISDYKDSAACIGHHYQDGNPLLSPTNHQPLQSTVSYTVVQCNNSKTLRTSPPVAIAMSCRVNLRLSPKPGAFTAQTCRPTFILQRFSISFLVILAAYNLPQTHYWTEAIENDCQI